MKSAIIPQFIGLFNTKGACNQPTFCCPRNLDGIRRPLLHIFIEACRGVPVRNIFNCIVTNKVEIIVEPINILNKGHYRDAPSSVDLADCYAIHCELCWISYEDLIAGQIKHHDFESIYIKQKFIHDFKIFFKMQKLKLFNNFYMLG